MENSLSYIVIDNNPAIQETILTYLQDISWLYCAGAFSRLSDALCYMKKHPVDIAFFDLDLPDIDGMDFLSFQKENNDIQAVITTILSDSNSRRICNHIHKGITGVIEKPINLENLQQIISTIKEKKLIQEREY